MVCLECGGEFTDAKHKKTRKYCSRKCFGTSKASVREGQRFGKLVAVKSIRKQGSCVVWQCKCDCGHRCEAQGRALKAGIKEHCGCVVGRVPRGAYPREVVRRLGNIKARAKLKGYEFNLTHDYLHKLIKETRGVCPVLGIPFNASGRDRQMSIDRIDNSLGYVTGNIQVMSNRANKIKNDATERELLKVWLFVANQTSIGS